MSRYKVNYKGMSISINVINNMYVTYDYGTEQLLGLEVIVNKKNGNTIYLGNFYVKMPKIVSQNEIEVLSKYLIDNIDYILYENSRFIGILENEKISDNKDLANAVDKKINKENDKELKKIYDEFFKTSSNSKEHEKYSRFLELYFNSHTIPDSIVGTYLSKRRKSILDYDDINYEIKRDFSMNMYDSDSTYEYENNLQLLNDLNISINSIVEEIKILEIIINRISDAESFIRNNNEIAMDIEKTNDELRNKKFFDRGKKELKVKLKNLKKGIIDFDEDLEKKRIKKKIEEEYTSKYEESKGLLDLINKLSFSEIKDVFIEIYDTRVKQHTKLVNRYNSIYDRVCYHQENHIDISELYDRIDKTK